jgi:hypothetical protein
MIRKRGLFIGREHVGKGVHIALGPMMNLVCFSPAIVSATRAQVALRAELPKVAEIGKDSVQTRSWPESVSHPFPSKRDSFSTPPKAAYETVLGLQAGGVQACAKHYINK